MEYVSAAHTNHGDIFLVICHAHALPMAVLFIAKGGFTEAFFGNMDLRVRATQKLVIPLQGKERPNDSIRRYRRTACFDRFNMTDHHRKQHRTPLRS